MEPHPEVKVTGEEILEAERKVRPLVLDPIIIASFGDFQAAFKKYLSYSYKDSGCTSQSTPPSGPGGTQTGTSSANQSCCNTYSLSAGSGKWSSLGSDRQLCYRRSWCLHIFHHTSVQLVGWSYCLSLRGAHVAPYLIVRHRIPVGVRIPLLVEKLASCEDCFFLLCYILIIRKCRITARET